MASFRAAFLTCFYRLRARAKRELAEEVERGERGEAGPNKVSEHRYLVRTLLSADQCLAISEHLLARGDADDMARGNFFNELAETAATEDWPSSPAAPFLLLTKEEGLSIWDADPETRNRLFSPYLTSTEQAKLSRRAKEAAELAAEAFAKLGPKSAR